MTQGPRRENNQPILLERFPQRLARVFEELCVVREYEPGDCILGSGHSGLEVRFILTGQATAVLRDDNEERMAVCTLNVGDIFGGTEYFFGVPWGFEQELIADTNCSVLEIEPHDFDRLFHEKPDLAMELVRILVRSSHKLQRDIFEAKLRRRALQSVVSQKDHMFPDYVMGDLVRRRVTSHAATLAQLDAPVLILGESGVGKEGVAHEIFRLSHQCKEVFLKVDLMESTDQSGLEGAAGEAIIHPKELSHIQHRLLFGFQERTPEGNTKINRGYFELCNGGTLLIRGVERLTYAVQLQLMEALATGTFQPAGAVRKKTAKVRLMATTRLKPDQILPEESPLLYVMLKYSINVPPLRARRKDIPKLANDYLSKFSEQHQKKAEPLPRETIQILVNHSWPGNDMELATKLRSALITSRNGTITPRDIPLGIKRPTKSLWKFNLLKLGAIKRLLLSPVYPAALQAACVPLFLIALLLLFFGPNNPQANPAAVLSWALGWPVLILGAFFAGRAWCSMCPIGAMAQTVRRIVCLDRQFPQFLKQHSDFLVAGAILAIMWFEAATDIRNSPLNLGFLLLAMLISAVIVNAIYEKESWCLYLCGLGGIVGAVAKTSPIELRADRNICIARCDTNDCLSGTSEVEGCPFGQAGPKLLSNRLCKLCARCIKNCPHDAFNLNLRLPGSEIWEAMHAHPGTAFLVVGMLGGLLCEMVSHTDAFHQIVAALAMPRMVVFTCLFLGVTLIANLMLVAMSACSRLVVEEDFVRNYARFGLALLPLAVMGFMAYHIFYLLNVGHSISTLAQQYTQAGIFLDLDTRPNESVLYDIQAGLIIVGVVWSALLMCFVARSVSENFRKAILGALPHIVLTILFAITLVLTIHTSFYGGL